MMSAIRSMNWCSIAPIFSLATGFRHESAHTWPLARVCEQTYRRFTAEGWLDHGLPPQYGCGRRGDLARLGEQNGPGAGELAAASESAGRGDIDRLLTEWRSLLRLWSMLLRCAFWGRRPPPGRMLAVRWDDFSRALPHAARVTPDRRAAGAAPLTPESAPGDHGLFSGRRSLRPGSRRTLFREVRSHTERSCWRADRPCRPRLTILLASERCMRAESTAYRGRSFTLMPNLNPEQFARQQIDTQLVACGWVVQDKKAIDFQRWPRHRRSRNYPTDTGPADYVLFVDKHAAGVDRGEKGGSRSEHHGRRGPDRRLRHLHS